MTTSPHGVELWPASGVIVRCGALERAGEPANQQRFLLTRQRWEHIRPQHRQLLGGDIQLAGFEALRAQLDGS